MKKIQVMLIQKAIEDKNFLKFIYEKQAYVRIQPLSMQTKENLAYLKTDTHTFDIDKIEKLTILKEKFQ